MKSFIQAAIICTALVVPAYAQEDKPYTITVTLSDLNTISDGLMQVPYGKAFPVINKLRQQVVAQQSKPVEKPTNVPENNVDKDHKEQ